MSEFLRKLQANIKVFKMRKITLEVRAEKRRIAYRKKQEEIFEKKISAAAKLFQPIIEKELLKISQEGETECTITGSMFPRSYIFDNGISYKMVYEYLQTEGQLLHGMRCNIINGTSMTVTIPFDDQEAEQEVDREIEREVESEIERLSQSND